MAISIEESEASIRRVAGEGRIFAGFAFDDSVTRQAATALVLAASALVLGNLLLAAIDDEWAFAARLRHIVDLSREGSLSERYLQGVCFFAAGIFALSACADRARAPAVLALLYAFIWFDDTALYHETAGGWIATRLDLVGIFGLRAQDLGEILAWGVAAIPLAAAGGWAWRSRLAGDAGLAIWAGATFAILVFFGLVVDMLHILAPRQLQSAIGIVEDGGETLAASMTAAVAVALLRIGEPYRASCRGEM